MLKKITALLLAVITLFALCACGGEDTSSEASKEESKAETSADASADASEDASESASENASEEESSEDTSASGYVDEYGYKQYLAVAEVDEVLANRGFKDEGANSDYVPLNYDKMKAVWISQFDFANVYTNGANQRSESGFKKLVNQAYDNLLSLGFNTVIVQVRPNADSFYPSAYYPYSGYVLQDYGKAAKYDALKIMVELAHQKGLSFHAWINPMRGMSPANLEKVNDAYPMKSWTKVANKKRCSRYLYTRSADGLYYLNISFDEVKELIVNGAAEIVRYYDVDGVHMDDYFYFGEDQIDSVEYNQAAGKTPGLTLQQFRYKHLNTLISDIYSAIKTENENVLFGISPAGNLDQMATKYYADVRTWLSQDGYVDYIMPQIYFGMEHSSWGFATTYQKWSAITTNPNIRFMAGMSLGKALAASSGNGDQYAGAGVNEWIDNKDVFKKCFEYSIKQSNYSGFAIFAYQYMFDPVTGNPVAGTMQEITNAKPYLTDIIKGEVIKY